MHLAHPCAEEASLRQAAMGSQLGSAPADASVVQAYTVWNGPLNCMTRCSAHVKEPIQNVVWHDWHEDQYDTVGKRDLVDPLEWRQQERTLCTENPEDCDTIFDGRYTMPSASSSDLATQSLGANRYAQDSEGVSAIDLSKDLEKNDINNIQMQPSKSKLWSPLAGCAAGHIDLCYQAPDELERISRPREGAARCMLKGSDVFASM